MAKKAPQKAKGTFKNVVKYSICITMSMVNDLFNH